VNHIPDTEEKVVPSRYQAPPDRSQTLLTLKEDAELSSHELKQSKDFPMKLTQSLLHMSQKQRSHLEKGEFLQRYYIFYCLTIFARELKMLIVSSFVECLVITFYYSRND